MKRLTLNSRRLLTCVAVVFALGAATVLVAPGVAAEPAAGGSSTAKHAAQETSYYAYVACESEDEVALVRLVAPAEGEPRMEVVKRIRVGIYDLETEGPHGVGVSPDGKYWFVSIAHGRPFGKLCKYTTADDELVAEVELGMFPATMQISPATGLLHIVNFNLHGGHVPSTVSIVEPNEMVELARVPTGIMPHGSRFSVDGLKHYSLSMMTDELFEIDAMDLAVSRTMNVHSGEGKMHMMHDTKMHDTKDAAHEAHGADAAHGVGHGKADHDNAGHDATHGDAGHAGLQDAQHKTDAAKTDHAKDAAQKAGQHQAGQHTTAQHGVQHADQKHGDAAQHGEMKHGAQEGMQHEGMEHHAISKPTWVQMHPTKPLAYVANNGDAEVIELNLDEWKITRRFKTGKGPYNVEVTPDGTKFVVTYKSDGATGIWDIESGKELARIENSRKVPHGIAITPDSRFAIVTVEGVGGEPGGVDAIDLQTLKLVDVANVGKQAGGIAFWKMEVSQ